MAPEKKSKWGKVGKVALLFVALIVVSYAIAAQVMGISSAAGRYQESHDAAKQAGLWFTGEEAAVYMNVPLGDNGAPEIDKLLEIVNSQEYYDLSKVSAPDFLHLWGKVKPLLPDLRAALLKPRFSWSIDPKDPYERRPKVYVLPKLVGVLLREMTIARREGKQEDACDLLNLSEELSARIDEDPRAGPHSSFNVRYHQSENPAPHTSTRA